MGDIPSVAPTEVGANISAGLVIGGGVASFVVDNIQLISVGIMAFSVLSQCVFNILTQLRLSRSDRQKD
jgi:hypothetical protein